MAKRGKKATFRITFAVSLVLPPGARAAAAREYIEDAVASWRGQLRPPGGYDDNDPGDQLFNLDTDTIRVTRLRSRKK